jgi:hypothetical protein
MGRGHEAALLDARKSAGKPQKRKTAALRRCPPPLSKSNASLPRPFFSSLSLLSRQPPSRRHQTEGDVTRTRLARMGPTRQPPVPRRVGPHRTGRGPRTESSRTFSPSPAPSTALPHWPIPRLLKTSPARRARHRSSHRATTATKKKPPAPSEALAPAACPYTAVKKERGE